MTVNIMDSIEVQAKASDLHECFNVDRGEMGYKMVLIGLNHPGGTVVETLVQGYKDGVLNTRELLLLATVGLMTLSDKIRE